MNRGKRILLSLVIVLCSFFVIVYLRMARQGKAVVTKRDIVNLHVQPSAVAEERENYKKKAQQIITFEKMHAGLPHKEGDAGTRKSLDVPQTLEQVLALGELMELEGPEGYFTPESMAACAALLKVRDPKLLSALLVIFERYMEGIVSYDAVLKATRTGSFQRKYDTAKSMAAALGEMRDARSLPALFESLGKLEGAETWAISRYGSKVLGDLVGVAKETKDKWRKEGACRAISEIEDPTAKDELLRIFKEEKDPDMRGAGAKALMGMKDEEVLAEVLERFKAEPDGMVKDSIIFSLHDRKNVPFLIDAIKGEQDELVRQSIVMQMDEIKDPSTIPALEMALKDESRNVRQLAAEALQKLTGKEYEWERRSSN